jgi:hypothetical protein
VSAALDHTTIAALEAAMGHNLEDYVAARRAYVPALGADSMRVGSAVAAFTGRASPPDDGEGGRPQSAR